MNKRVFLIILDSFGVGEAPDASAFGDAGSNTLLSISKSKYFKAENLKKLGLFNIDGIANIPEFKAHQLEIKPIGAYGKMQEKSNGKDTTIGHYELAGLISNKPFPTYANGFPKSVIDEFEREIGTKILCNKPYSGTEVIKDYGAEHLKTGYPIVYTSQDSVFQIACHDGVVPLEKLYNYCEIARKILKGEHAVSRVIARPFTGEYPFVRTPYRHDYALKPHGTTMLDLLCDSGLEVISIGKIYDIFAGQTFTKSVKTLSNADGMEKLKTAVKENFDGLCFANLVDFDSKYGHRNDIDGYANAISEFDEFLGEFLPTLNSEDLLIITADHGCDPSTPSTDHSREYVPLLVYGEKVVKNANLGVRECFADVAKTILEYFSINSTKISGTSFLKDILK